MLISPADIPSEVACCNIIGWDCFSEIVGEGTQQTEGTFLKAALPPNLEAMASNLIAMASNIEAMAKCVKGTAEEDQQTERLLVRSPCRGH